MHEKEILRKIQGRGCSAEERRGGRGQSAILRRRNLPKGENINMKDHYVSAAEEAKSPHRQLYK